MSLTQNLAFTAILLALMVLSVLHPFLGFYTVALFCCVLAGLNCWHRLSTPTPIYSERLFAFFSFVVCVGVGVLIAVLIVKETLTF